MPKKTKRKKHFQSYGGSGATTIGFTTTTTIATATTTTVVNNPSIISNLTKYGRGDGDGGDGDAYDDPKMWYGDCELLEFGPPTHTQSRSSSPPPTPSSTHYCRLDRVTRTTYS